MLRTVSENSYRSLQHPNSCFPYSSAKLAIANYSRLVLGRSWAGRGYLIGATSVDLLEGLAESSDDS
jgi:hypothetical protein